MCALFLAAMDMDVGVLVYYIQPLQVLKKYSRVHSRGIPISIPAI
jgi:hypothetical protein